MKIFSTKSKIIQNSVDWRKLIFFLSVNETKVTTTNWNPWKNRIWKKKFYIWKLKLFLLYLKSHFAPVANLNIIDLCTIVLSQKCTCGCSCYTSVSIRQLCCNFSYKTCVGLKLTLSTKLPSPFEPTQASNLTKDSFWSEFQMLFVYCTTED